MGLLTLTQTRGDTRGYYFTRVDGAGQVISATPDSLYFTVKTSFNTPQFVLQKSLADMTIDEEYVYHFTILPEDTERLPYGTYVFDIQVTQDGVVTTIAKGKFVLTQEATWAINEGD